MVASPLSLSGWIYLESASGDVDMISCESGASYSEIYVTNGLIAFSMNNGATLYTQAMSTNTWTHLAATTDGTNLRSYVNGALVDTRAYTTVLTNVTKAYIGYFGATSQIQDVMMFSATLSTTDIAALYRLRRPYAKRSNLHAWWPLHSDSATKDLSGGGHTLTGAGDSAGTVHAPAIWGSAQQQRAIRR